MAVPVAVRSSAILRSSTGGLIKSRIQVGEIFIAYLGKPEKPITTEDTEEHGAKRQHDHNVDVRP